MTGLKQIDLDLIVASKEGKIDVIRRLIAEKANLNAQAIDGKTPLMWASISGKAAVIKVLIESGADIDLKGGELDGSALIYAVNEGQSSSVLELLKAGADMKVTSAEGGDAWAYAYLKGHKEIASVLEDAWKYPERYDKKVGESFKEQIQKMSGTEILNLPKKNKELLERIYWTGTFFQIAFDKLSYSEQKLFYAQTYKTVKKEIRSIMEQQLRERSRQQG